MIAPYHERRLDFFQQRSATIVVIRIVIVIVVIVIVVEVSIFYTGRHRKLVRHVDMVKSGDDLVVMQLC